MPEHYTNKEVLDLITEVSDRLMSLRNRLPNTISDEAAFELGMATAAAHVAKEAVEKDLP